MKRKIIKINEDKCTGCGECVPNCPEGALQVIDGKARLVGELLCDGFGACVGRCPEGAMTIEEREAEDYDEKKVMANIVKAGPAVLKAHLKHLKDHRQDDYYTQAVDYLKNHNMDIPKEEDLPKASLTGCPGMMMQDFRKEASSTITQPVSQKALTSQLRQWPVQLQLLSPRAPYFKDSDLLIAADCVPFSFANFHERFLKGKTLIILCPKLDQVKEMYLEKLTQIFKNNSIKSVTILHMEVPCCFGTVAFVEDALKRSGKNILVKEYTISLRGEII